MIFMKPKIVQAFYSNTKPDMMKCLAELDQLQWMSLDEQMARQHKHLYQVLEYANTYVPYYRDLFKEIDFHPEDFVKEPNCFQNIPLLTKDIARQQGERLITTEPARQNSLIKAKTGGTTGEPMRFVQDKVYNDYRVAHNFHQMQWSGWQLGQPEGRLWGHVLVEDSGKKSNSTKLKEWMINRFSSNAFHMTPESMEKFAMQLKKYPGSLVWSYVSTIYRFAQFVQERGHPIKLHAVFTAAEPLYEYHREFIQNVFDCPVFNSYSSVEIGDIACECDRHNGLHLLMRNCYLEILRDGQPVSDGEGGEFILTNLTNLAFPLIRYKIEDWGKKRVGQCSCGRGSLVLEVVEGRMMDLFKARDGGIVYGAFAIPMVPALGGVKQYQVIQKSLDLVVFRIVQEGAINQDKLREIEQASKIAFGEQVEVRFEFVDYLPTSPTGKHQYLVSEVE